MVAPTMSPGHYEESTLPPCADPLSAATYLVGSGLWGTYVLYEQAGCWSLGLGMLAEVTVDRSEAVLRTAEGTHRALPWRAAPLERVSELLAALPDMRWRAYGWAGFELAYACAGMRVPGDETLLHLVVPELEIRWEPDRTLVRGTDPERMAQVGGLVTNAPAAPVYRPSPVDVAAAGRAAYREAVASAVREIRDRQVQKVILSRVVPVEQPVDLVGSYVTGRRSNTPSRSFLLSVGGMQAAGFSPEIVAQVDRSRRVRTQPLAGTRALAGSDEEDLRLRTDLLQDAKEIFEHAISVKACCDELEALCEPRSVVVDDFMSVKRRGTVQHLASTVSGQLPAHRDVWQAFAALFPAVTASGVPKAAAYRCIQRHEPHRRGLYSGAVLTVDHDGALDAALVLRTIFRQGGKTWLRAGAGIVEQSRPDREFEETCEKLRSVALHLVSGAPPAG